MRIKDKVALVTGGGAGIGAATALRLAEEGATVIVSDVNLASAEIVAEQIVTGGGQSVAIHQDVTDESRWKQVMTRIIDDFDRLDVLVNNAGIALIGTAEDTSLEDWRVTQQVNLESVFIGTREAIKVIHQIINGFCIF